MQGFIESCKNAYKYLTSKNNSDHVAILVMGDIGRSPRMCYHANSLAVHSKKKVDFVGFGGFSVSSRLLGSEMHPSVAHPNITTYHLGQFNLMNKPEPDAAFWQYLIFVILKVIYQLFALLYCMLWVIPQPSHLLIQVIDWHNYGYTILGMSKGKSSVVTTIYKYLEKFFGLGAFGNLCVTDAMRTDLKANWGINASTLHDKPAKIFAELSIDEISAAMKKIQKNETFKNLLDTGFLKAEDSILTQKIDNKTYFRNQKPVMIVTCTSYTVDEDLSLLLKAAKELDEISQNSKTFPKRLLVIITGKGPLKKYYLKIIAQMKLQNVRIITPWLEAEDYPKLLGCCDIGVSLHESSSGVDLPMKVVDMFGCCLPVCAVNFPALPELVLDGENGYVFEKEIDPESKTSPLTEKLLSLIDDKNILMEMRKHIRENFKTDNWDKNWIRQAKEIFELSSKID